MESTKRRRFINLTEDLRPRQHENQPSVRTATMRTAAILHGEKSRSSQICLGLLRTFIRTTIVAKVGNFLLVKCQIDIH
jgi:hypothetical protein